MSRLLAVVIMVAVPSLAHAQQFKINELERKVRDLEMKVREVERQRDEAKRERDDAKMKLRDVERQRDEFKTKVKIVVPPADNGKIAELQGKLRATETKLGDAERQRDEARKERADVNRDKDRVKRELEDKLRQATLQIDQLKRDKDTAQRGGNDKGIAVQGLKNQADNTQRELDRLRAELKLRQAHLERHARLHRALATARAGNLANAVVEADVLAQAQDLDAVLCAALARIYALAAADTGNSERALIYADRAVALLSMARDRGLLATRQEIEQLSRDADFRVLSNRDSFRSLVGNPEKLK